MPHESTVHHSSRTDLTHDGPRATRSRTLIEENGFTPAGDKSVGGVAGARGVRRGEGRESQVPHLFAETPVAITHDHDEGSSDEDSGGPLNGSGSALNSSTD